MVDYVENYLDIRDITRLFWRGRYVILLGGLLLAAVAWFVAANRPDVYSTSVLLRPAQDEADPARNVGAISSLATLGGLRMGYAQSQADLAIAVLESRQFLTSFARKHDIVPELIAAEAWDKKTSQLIYDPRIYSRETQTWVRNVDPPATPEPSDSEIFEALKKIIQVQVEQDTGFVRLSLTFISPVQAEAWASQLISDLNEVLRSRAVAELDLSIDYLQTKMQETNLADVRASLGQLLQNKIHERMLADAKSEYALQTLDPAYIPQFKSGPARGLMILAGAVLGCLLGVLVMLVYVGLRPTPSD